MIIPENAIPIIEISLKKDVKLFIKREDLIHPEISGNKYWKLFYNINQYLEQKPEKPTLITFGGAYSNHIAAVAALGNEIGVSTVGIIRGDELEKSFLQNSTLNKAYNAGMRFRFVTRAAYRDKESLTINLQEEFQGALVIPEGGTNELAVKGVQHMLSPATKSFDYLCTAVGTGGTIAGLSLFAEENQQILGFNVVSDPSLSERIFQLSKRDNFKLINAHDGGYGKITDENIRFINAFAAQYGIWLDPVYTGKMMMKILELIADDFFPEESTILAFHTGGLQGIEGANEMLQKQNRELIKFDGAIKMNQLQGKN